MFSHDLQKKSLVVVLKEAIDDEQEEFINCFADM